MVSFEETNAAVIKAMSDRGYSGGRPADVAVAGAGGAPDSPICSIYEILKPMLQGLMAFPFFPKNWKTAIANFMAALEGLCPGGHPTAMTMPPASDQETIDQRVQAAVIAHLQKHGFPPSASAAATFAPADVMNNLKSKICPFYKAVKPILDLVKTFVPGPWGVGIGIAEGVLDQVCQ